jgi:hypothetical protein
VHGQVQRFRVACELLGESRVRESLQNETLEKRPVQVISLLTLDLEGITIDFRPQLPKCITQIKASREVI